MVDRQKQKYVFPTEGNMRSVTKMKIMPKYSLADCFLVGRPLKTSKYDNIWTSKNVKRSRLEEREDKTFIIKIFSAAFLNI